MLIIPLHSRQALKQFPRPKFNRSHVVLASSLCRSHDATFFVCFFWGRGGREAPWERRFFVSDVARYGEHRWPINPGRFNVQKILVCWVVFCSGSFSNWKTNKNNWGIRLLLWGLSCKFKIWKSLGDKQRSPTKMFSKSCLLGARKSDNNL